MARISRIFTTHDVRIPATKAREISTFAADCHYSPFFTFAPAARGIPPFPALKSVRACEGM
jgi:hypothetical protein